MLVIVLSSFISFGAESVELLSTTQVIYRSNTDWLVNDMGSMNNGNDGNLGTHCNFFSYQWYKLDTPKDITGYVAHTSNVKTTHIWTKQLGSDEWVNHGDFIKDGTMQSVNFTNVEYIGFTGYGTYITEMQFYGYDTQPPDSIPPSNITDLTYAEGETTIDFNWTNPNDSDFDKVNIYRDSILIDSVRTDSYIDSDLTKDTEYFYKITTVDISGNESIGIILNCKTLSELDTVPPMSPTNFNVSFDAYKNVLTWINPSDADFKHIEIYKDSVLIATTNTESCNDIKIESDTSYNYEICAVDTSLNKSSNISQSITTGTIDASSSEILFGTITDTLGNMVDSIKISSIYVISTGLSLVALIVGSFYLMGLGKKTIKKAK